MRRENGETALSDAASRIENPSGSEAVAVRTRGLTKRFGELTAVDRLELSVPQRTIFGLLGTNGAGKTTVIKMLTTLIPASEGSAEVAGIDIVSHPGDVRWRIGYVSQLLSADAEMTGYENLLISAKLYDLPSRERASRIREALRFMGLSGAADKMVSQYSGGMIRRLEIAQSMLHRPPVLFLDEPTVGLDPVARRGVWERIRELRDAFGTAILMTTHDMEEADALCDTVGFMHLGHLVAVGAPAQLKAMLGPDATLDDVFIHYTGPATVERGDYREVVRARRTAQRLE